MPLFAHGAMPQDAGAKAPPSPPSIAGETPDVLGFGELTNRMTVPVSVDGKGPFDFIVDTGAERSVLSRELAASLDLEPGARARLFDFTGASPVNTVKVPSLSAGKLNTAAMEAPSLAMANIGAQGMLGIDALQGHKVVIDFGRNRMSVVPARRHPTGEIIVRAEARLGQLIVTTARFNGEPIAVIIDTGSWVSVGNKAMLALAKKQPRRLGPITVRSVTGRTFQADYVSVSDLNVGGVRFDNVGLAFADVPPFVRFGLRDKPALILGMSALKLFRRVEIDFVNREIAFSLPAARIDFLNVCRGSTVCRRY
jgi:predicted aspartyl protease